MCKICVYCLSFQVYDNLLEQPKLKLFTFLKFYVQNLLVFLIFFILYIQFLKFFVCFPNEFFVVYFILFMQTLY